MRKKAPSLRIASAQINPTLGDFKGNANKIVTAIQRAAEKRCQLVIFPESSLFGYHPFDLLERPQIVEDQLKAIQIIEEKIPKGVFAIIGAITLNPAKRGRPYYNSAILISKQGKRRVFHKQLLPTGDVFDEARFIEPGQTAKNIFKLFGKSILITICEDIWAWDLPGQRNQYQTNPLEKLKGQKVDLVINLSASPFYVGKRETRELLVKKTAKFFKAPVIYTNMVGAQDEIIFDGASFALDKAGKKIMQSIEFEEDLNWIDIESKEGGERGLSLGKTEARRKAIVLGIKDFCQKTGLKTVHFGLSGGVDSALVACLAVDALGPANVKAFALPSEFNSSESLSYAQALAINLGIELRVLEIHQPYVAVKALLEQIEIQKFSLVHENLQARLRGLLLMAFANHKNSLLLNTSNKSELAAGYSTLYGDLCGGLCPIGDLTKGQVYQLCDLYNSERELIPRGILERAPSAELRPNQKDQDSLPAYDLLDASVIKLIEDAGDISTAVDRWLISALVKSEFKRWQAPPIIKLSRHSFGRGRRFPVACQI